MSGSEIDFRPLAEPVARALLGEPNSRLSKPGELRFGTNGSMKVLIAGTAAIMFTNHETGVSGGLLDLIVLQRGGDRKEAMVWLSSEFGVGERKSKRVAGHSIAAVYPYFDADGERQFEVVRLEPKYFRQRRSDTEWGVKGCPVLPYWLPELMEAVAHGRAVLIVEGEKDADRLARLGIAATCNAGGVGGMAL